MYAKKAHLLSSKAAISHGHPALGASTYSVSARNYFAPVQDTLKQNQFGGSFGGPILKNKLFFFGTYQGTRVRSTSQSQIAFVPDAAERTGDFSELSTQLIDPSSGAPFPQNKIPASGISPIAQNFLKYLPLPNGPDGQITFAGPRTQQNDDQWLIKVDADLGKHRLSGRYFWTRFDQPPFIFTNNMLAADSNGNQVTVQNYSINDVFTVSPTLFFNAGSELTAKRADQYQAHPFPSPTKASKSQLPLHRNLTFTSKVISTWARFSFYNQLVVS